MERTHELRLVMEIEVERGALSPRPRTMYLRPESQSKVKVLITNPDNQQNGSTPVHLRRQLDRTASPTPLMDFEHQYIDGRKQRSLM
jgi:hypothetical protein